MQLEMVINNDMVDKMNLLSWFDQYSSADENGKWTSVNEYKLIWNL